MQHDHSTKFSVNAHFPTPSEFCSDSGHSLEHRVPVILASFQWGISLKISTSPLIALFDIKISGMLCFSD